MIDAGGAARAAWINALVLAATLAAKALCGEQAIAVLVVAIGAALFGGLYNPSLMTAIYNVAKASPARCATTSRSRRRGTLAAASPA